jgi:hypothetical protein
MMSNPPTASLVSPTGPFWVEGKHRSNLRLRRVASGCGADRQTVEQIGRRKSVPISRPAVVCWNRGSTKLAELDVVDVAGGRREVRVGHGRYAPNARTLKAAASRYLLRTSGDSQSPA